MHTRHMLVLAASLFLLPLGSALADHCASRPRCYDAGPFSTTVSNLVTSWGRYHKQQFVRLNLRFRNHGAQPLILAFRWGSAASLTDNYGNGYRIDTRFQRNVVGLGLIRRAGVDASFVVAPGGRRDASLIFNRWVGKSAIGSQYSADFSVEQLQLLPGGRQVHEAGHYSISFSNLSGAMPGGALGSVGTPRPGLDGLLKLFSHKRKH